MNWVLLISIAIHLIALVWSVESLRRLRDWRLAFLSLMLALMVLHRGLALSRPGVVSMSQQWADLPVLVISVMSLLAAFFLGTLLDELKRSRESGKRANEELGERRRQAIIETEPERAEETLAASEARFRAIVERGGDAFALLDANGIVTFSSPATDHTLGYRSEEFLGRSVFDLVHPDDQPSVRDTFAKLVQEPATEVRVQFQALHKNGSWRWIDVIGCNRLTDSNLQGIVVNYRDITDSKRIAVTLQESEERYRTLIDQAADGIFIADAQGRYVDVNRMGCTMLGCTRDEILRLHIGDVVASDELPRIAPELEQLGNGEVVRGEWQFRRKDGSTFPGEVVGKMLSCGRLLGILRDITERRQAEQALHAREQRFRALIEHSFDAIALVGQDGIFLYGTPSATRITGRSVEEYLGKSAFERIHPDDLQHVRNLFAELLSNPGQTLRSQFRLRHKDESWIWLEVTATNLLNQPAVQAIVANYRDITEHRRAEEESRRFGRILDDSLNEIYIFDAASLRFDRVNVGARRNLGYTMEELSRLTPLDLKPEFNRERFEALVEPLRTGRQQRAVFETIHRRRDGSTYPVEVHLQLANADEPPLFVAIIQDITERKRAEQALRDNEVRLAGLINTAMDAIITFDEEQQVVLFNSAAERIFRRTAAEVMGKSIHQFIPERFHFTHDEQMRQFGNSDSPVRQMGERRQVVGLLPDGSEFPAEASILQLEVSGKRFFTVILRDISERKRAYEALRESQTLLEMILDSIPQGVFWKDRNSVYLGANRVTREAVGLDNPESIVGLTNFQLPSATPEEAKYFTLKDREVMDSNQPQFGIVETITRSDGSIIWLETNKLPMHDAEGHVIGILGTSQDITERKRADDELRASRERLQVLSRQLLNAQEAERRHIARELHDQIGQSLTAIKLNLKMLQPSAHETPTHTILHETIAVVDQTLEQVRTLSLELRPSMLDDLGLAAALRWYLDRQAQRAGFSVQFASELSGGDVSKEIETTCFRVAQEIVTNIARHARAQNVRVELRRLDTELELFIQDDGVGFDLTAAREQAPHETSLGLLGMQERLLIVGGRLDIQTAPSRGTEVHVRFPLMPTTAGSETEMPHAGEGGAF